MVRCLCSLPGPRLELWTLAIRRRDTGITLKSQYLVHMLTGVLCTHTLLTSNHPFKLVN
jgi:hypothetical protein